MTGLPAQLRGITILIAGIVLCATLLIAVQPMLAQSTATGGLVGLVFDFDAQAERIARFDRTTGTVQVLGSGAAKCCGLTASNAVYDPGTAAVHAVMSGPDGQQRFFTFDAITGSASAGPELPADEWINYMAYDSRSRQLVGLAYSAAQRAEGLVHIDAATGKLTWYGEKVAECCNINVLDAAIDVQRRRLYTVMDRLDEGKPRVFAFDIDSGKLLTDPQLAGTWEINYLGLQQSSGRLYALVYDSVLQRELMTEIDTKTGRVTAIGAGLANCCSINTRTSAFDGDLGLMTVPLSYFASAQVRLMTWSITTGNVVEEPIYEGGKAINYLIYDPQLPAPPAPTPTPPPVLAISKSAPASAAAGAPVTYRLTVANSGDAAANVVISDVLPSVATPVAVSPGGTISALWPPARASVSWAVGPLAPGAAETVSVTVIASQTLINDTYAASDGGGLTVRGAAPVLTLVGADTVTGTVEISGSLVLTSTDGAVVLDLPPSDATSMADVRMTSASLPGAAFPGPVFEATVIGAAGEAITSFDPPLAVTVTYADADWQAAGILREEDLNVFFWNGSGWEPVLPCAGCTHDLTRNEFKLRLDHLTLFAVRSRTEVFLPAMLRQLPAW